MNGGLHNASHLCYHRPGGAVHVEVLEARVEILLVFLAKSENHT